MCVRLDSHHFGLLMMSMCKSLIKCPRKLTIEPIILVYVRGVASRHVDEHEVGW